MQGQTLSWVQSEQQWRDAKAFYAHHHAGRVLRKERIAVLMNAREQWLACARLRTVGEVQLLVGVLVEAALRGQGVAAALLESLQPMFTSRQSYLFCEPSLTALYQRHGFVSCEQPAPPLVPLLARYRRQQSLVCMHYQGSFE
ncbi:MAG: GNAT family N-acetyltransferase [Pseudomonadales bacterium]